MSKYILPNMIQQIKTNPGLIYLARNNQVVELKLFSCNMAPLIIYGSTYIATVQ